MRYYSLQLLITSYKNVVKRYIELGVRTEADGRGSIEQLYGRREDVIHILPNKTGNKELPGMVTGTFIEVVLPLRRVTNDSD